MAPGATLNAPGSDLVLPPEAGLLVMGATGPRRQTTFQVQIASDTDTRGREASHLSPLACGDRRHMENK